MRRAIAGDRTALDALWAEHRRWVVAVLLAHKPACSDVDDLLQEVAVSLVTNISSLSEPASFVPWLRTVATNVARLAGRKASSGLGRVGFVRGEAALVAIEAHATADRTTSGPHATDPPRGSLSESDDARVAGAVGGRNSPGSGASLLEHAATLPETYREALLLRCVQGLSYRQIGEVLGLPETTIETRVARGRRLLRERAQAAGVGPGPTAG